MGTRSGWTDTAVQCRFRMWHGDADVASPDPPRRTCEPGCFRKRLLEGFQGVGHLHPPLAGRIHQCGEGRRGVVDPDHTGRRCRGNGAGCRRISRP